MVTLADLWQNQDGGDASILVLFDLRVAFDSVSGDRSRKRCALMVHLLLQQPNPVRVDGGERLHLSLSYMGVPQVSMLPLLPFIIYMKVLGEDVCQFGMQYHQCTGDTSSTSQLQIAQMKLFNVLCYVSSSVRH